MRVPNFEIMLLKSPEDPTISQLVLAFAWDDISDLSPHKAWQEDGSPLFSLKWNTEGLMLSIPDTLKDQSSSVLFPFYTPSSDTPSLISPTPSAEEEFLTLQLMEQTSQKDNPEHLVLSSVMKSMIRDHQGLFVVPFNKEGEALSQISFKVP